jgi:autotransporter-associated beta strand protein
MMIVNRLIDRCRRTAAHRFVTRAVAGLLLVAAFPAAADRTVEADWKLTADETVDGTLTVPAGVTVDLAGYTLTVKGLAGDGVITSSPKPSLDPSVEPPAFVARESTFWLDASDTSTLTSADGLVSKWASKSQSTSRTAVEVSGSQKPSYNTDTYGIPTVDFGVTGSKKDLGFDRVTGIKTVFWVVRIESSPNAFLLGDTSYYNFHRGEQYAQYMTDHGVIKESVWDGRIQVPYLQKTPDPDRFHVISARMTSGSGNANRLTKDRSSAQRNGGRQLSELITFSRALSDEERLAVTAYLENKWGIHTGTLRVSVDENVTVNNSTVTLDGNLTFVKTGKGAFTASKSNQTYTESTVVEEGRLTFGTKTHPLGPGNGRLFVTVNTNAYVDVADQSSTTTANYIWNLAGTVRVQGASGDYAYGAGHEVFSRYVNLFGDARLEGNSFTLGVMADNPPARLNFLLNGHTLTYAAEYSFAKNINLTDGTVVWLSGRTEATATADFSSITAVYHDPGHAHLGDNGFSVSELDYNASYAVTHRSANQVFVGKRYIAGPVRPWLTLQSGCILDLSRLSEPFTLSGQNAVASSQANRKIIDGTVTLLSESASYTIDIGAREVSVGDCLVRWTAKPKESVLFTLVCEGPTPEEREIALALRDEGIFVKSTKIPYARWDLSATVPGWKFYYPDGTAAVDWTDGLTKDVEVRYFSYDELLAVKEQAVSPAAYVLDGRVTLPADVDVADLTGFIDQFAQGGVLDLNGRKAVLPLLRGFGTVTDSTTDAAHPGELHVNVPEGQSIENVVVTITGNVRLVKTGSGEMIANKPNQSYTGGTCIEAGVLTAATTSHPFGNGNGTQTITVLNGATLDLGNKFTTSTCRYRCETAGLVKLAGDSGAWAWDNARMPFSAFTLLGDAVIQGQNFAFGGASGSTLPLVMNGHSLTFNTTGTPYFVRIKSSGSGTVYLASQPVFSNQDDLSTVDLVCADGVIPHLGDAGFSVNGYDCNGTSWQTHRSANGVVVYGRYIASEIRPWMTLKSGATLDLSKVTGTWSADGLTPVSGGAHRTFTQPGRVAFEANAEIAVSLGDRRDLRTIINSSSPYLVTWSQEPNAVFTLDEASAQKHRCLIEKDATGLRVRWMPGFSVIVR